MLRYIDLSFFSDNHLDDSTFLKEILSTTHHEFKNLVNILNSLDSNPETFSSEGFYQLIHKYKPTVSMLKMKTYPLYLKYGSGDHLLNYAQFKEINPSLLTNLEGAIKDLEIELKKYQ